MGIKDLKTRYSKLKKELLKKSFERMNERQQEAIFSVNGPLMVLAGAGSGKTTVIVNRIVNMIKFGNAYFSDDAPKKADKNTVAQMESVLSGGGVADDVADIISCDKVNA